MQCSVRTWPWSAAIGILLSAAGARRDLCAPAALGDHPGDRRGDHGRSSPAHYGSDRFCVDGSDGAGAMGALAGQRAGAPMALRLGRLAGGTRAAFPRPDTGPAVIAATLPLFLLMARPQRRAFLIGGTCALVPLLVLTVVAGPVQIFNNLFLFPVIYSSPGRHMPRDTWPPYLTYLLLYACRSGADQSGGRRCCRLV